MCLGYAAEPNLRSHELDSQIWETEATRYKSVILIGGVEGALSHSECLYEKAKHFFQSKEEGLALGEVCGILVVAIRNFPSISQREEKFLLAHESFHLLGQIFSKNVAIDYFTRPRPEPMEADKKNLKRFFARISTAYNLCDELSEYYLSFSGRSIDYINYISIVEWPAEYYASKFIMKHESIVEAEYLNIRKKFGLVYEYYSGAVIGRWLDGKVMDWRPRVSRGESMLGIAAEKCGIDWPINNQPLLGTIHSMPAFGLK
jgi:hypothetical protein